MKYLMNAICMLLIGVIALSNFSCSEDSYDRDRFMNAYYDILVARESMPDTAESNLEVKNIYDKYEYTMQSFQEEYFYFATETETFIEIVDSLRNRAKADSKRIRDSLINETKEKIGSQNSTE